MKLKSIKNWLVQLFVLAAVLTGYQVFASEFDEGTVSAEAPEVVLVREDAEGNRTLFTISEVEGVIETEEERIALIEQAEANAEVVVAVEGQEGQSPSEFDSETGTPAWYYWYYPRTSYYYWYSYGNYSYYPAYSYNYGYYNYWYYYRW